MKTLSEIDTFTRAYIECALWSSTDHSDDQGGDPLDASYGSEDIAPATLQRMIEDCEQFQADNGIPEYGDPRFSDAEKAGHDFWLTRNHHGAGFWDRGLGEIGRKLTDAANAWGSFDLYVGDDGLIYGS